MMDRDNHNTKNLKKCVIGEGCKIHETAKLTNCIVMRNVSIMENVVLEARPVDKELFVHYHLLSCVFTSIQNCILCDYSVVRANCRLKKCALQLSFHFRSLIWFFRCSVGERYQVPDDKKSENAVFVVETMASEGGSLRRMTFDREATFGSRGGSMHEH
jgi:ADP-glucose pyrophosphorylase